MRWLYDFFSWLERWWRGDHRRFAFGATIRLESSADPKRELAAGKLVLVGTAEMTKWLRFACPCGCGDVIALNLMTSHRPHWKAELHEDGTLTVYPSVDSHQCGSHFWIRRSKIEWV
jgi:hypothetical protein